MDFRFELKLKSFNPTWLLLSNEIQDFIRAGRMICRV